MHLRSSKSKGIAIDGVKIKKAAELLGLTKIVFFSPEDLSIISTLSTLSGVIIKLISVSDTKSGNHVEI